MDTLKILVTSYVNGIYANSKMPPKGISGEVDDIVDEITKFYGGDFQKWLNYQKEMEKVYSNLCTPCSHCKKREAIHTDSEQSLCEVCMDELDLIWNPDYMEFGAKYRRCTLCGGTEDWCNSCEMYTCYGCSPYGTCQCS